MTGDSGKGRGLWGNTFWMSAAGLASAVLSVLRALLLPKLIADPAEYGLLLILNLIVGFGAYAHLGVTLGVYRQLPYLRGAGVGEEELARLRDSSLGFVLLTGLAAVLAAFLLGWSHLEAGTVLGFAILGAGALLVPLRNLTALLTNFYQAEERFKQLALLETGYFVCSVAVSLLGAHLWGVLGAALGLVLVELAFVFVYYGRLGVRLVPRLDAKRIASLLRVGLPLTLVVLLRFSLESVDKLFIARFLGGADRGFLNLAATVGMLIILVPGKLGMVLNPELARRTGAGQIGELKERLVRYTLVASYAGALVAGLTVIGARTLLFLWLPNYAPSLSLIDIYAPRMAFYAVITVAGNILVHLLLEARRAGMWLALLVGLLLLSVAGCALAMFRFGTAESIVWASTGVFIVYSFLVNYFAAGEVGMTVRKRLGFLLQVGIPLAYVGLVVEGLKHGLAWLEAASALARFGAGFGAYLLLVLPLVVYGERRLGLLRELRRRGRQFFTHGDSDV